MLRNGELLRRMGARLLLRLEMALFWLSRIGDDLAGFLVSDL